MKPNGTMSAGNGLVVDGSGCEIYVDTSSKGDSSSISAESVGVDLYGSSHALYILGGSQVTSSSGNGVSISSERTTVYVSGEGTLVSGSDCGINNNSSDGGSNVTINVKSGATVSAENDTVIPTASW